MATLTGQLGSDSSQLGLLQLGGPPAYPNATWTKSLPTTALPLVAHVYQADGVTFIGSLGPLLTHPSIKITCTNGSYDRLLLDLPQKANTAGGLGNTYGSHKYGSGIYGLSSGALTIALGDVVKLYEQGGNNTLIYAGRINSMPSTRTSIGTVHQIELVPFAFQLADSYVTLNYTVATDIGVMVRDAVAATSYVHCDQTSVPPVTGIKAILDFRNRPALDVLNTCIHVAGYSWFWHVGPTGRVWFQPMGSGVSGPGSQVYTAKMGVDYMAVSENGGSIEMLKNDILVIGGLNAANVTATAHYIGGSQATLGVQSLNPPLSYPSVTDSSTLIAIANGVGAILDRVWNRVQLSLLPGFGQRINMEQPGGAMLRYIEPTVNPMTESSTGTGNYIGPYIVHEVTLDGAAQQVTAGDAPVTDAHDFDFLVTQMTTRAAVGVMANPNALLTTPH